MIRCIMNKQQYDSLPRAAARARDREIIAGLSSWPQYIPEWDEYAAMTLAGDIVYGVCWDECRERQLEADELYVCAQK